MITRICDTLIAGTIAYVVSYDFIGPVGAACFALIVSYIFHDWLIRRAEKKRHGTHRYVPMGDEKATEMPLVPDSNKSQSNQR